MRGFACLNRRQFSGRTWEWNWPVSAHRRIRWPTSRLSGARPGLVRQATDPELGIPASLAGAREEWIALHEAAHAIVAVKAGIMVRGIRFYGDGLRGETGIEDLDWLESTDEQLLRGLVRLDVAGNVGEIIRGYEPKGGYLSRFFDDKDPAQPANYPSDVIAAWQQHGAPSRHGAIREGGERAHGRWASGSETRHHCKGGDRSRAGPAGEFGSAGEARSDAATRTLDGVRGEGDCRGQIAQASYSAFGVLTRDHHGGTPSDPGNRRRPLLSTAASTHATSNSRRC